MAFPSNPTLNQEHTEGSIQRIWDGKRWAINSARIIEGSGDGVPTVLDRGNAGTAIVFDVTAADIQYATLNSSTCAISFTGTPAAGEARWCQLHLIHDATANARAITWSGISWNNGSAPYNPEIQASARTTIEVLTLPNGTRLGYHSANF